MSSAYGSTWHSWAPWGFLRRQTYRDDQWITQVDVALFAAWTLVALLCAIAYATIRRGKGSIMWRYSFLRAVAWIAVTVQLVYVGDIAVLLPPHMKNTTMLVECRESTKGGKLTNTFRDCLVGQSGFCTKDEPCTPCDVYVAPFEFDAGTYEGYCEECSESYLGHCNFKGSTQGPYCQEFDGTIAPCRRCCLPSWGGAVIRKRMAESECGLVYNNDTFNWNSDEYEPCNATTSILTRFGCCPISDADDCARQGPRGGGWEFCFSGGYVDLNATAPTGCPIYSNGRLEELFCSILKRHEVYPSYFICIIF